MKDFLDEYGIQTITSSAYNPAGNLLAENNIRRVKRAIGRNKMEKAWTDIQALNFSSPFSNKFQSPFEAMYKFYPKPIGIPKPDFLRIENKTQRINYKNERNVDYKYGCSKWNERSFDRDKLTMKERLIDDFWEEKIHDKSKNSLLETGENIYYRDPTIKGFGRWRPGLILERKGEQENNGTLVKLKGYDILDTVTGKHTTRTREDIRIRKKSFLEDSIYKQYVEFLNKMHRASNANARPGEEYMKPVFKETHERETVTNQPPAPTNPNPTTDKDEGEATTNIEDITPETPTNAPERIPQVPEDQQQQPTEPPPERKLSREERNLNSDLGDYWRCTDHDPHYDGEIGRRLRARVTELIKVNSTEELEDELQDYWSLEDEKDEDFKKWRELVIRSKQ